MNTVLSRANSLFAFSLSVMAALTFGCFITTAFKDRSVPVRLHVSRIMLKNALNQVVLWDKIVLRGDNPKLLLKDMKTKYFFFDDGNGLKGNRNVTLTLSWNVVPNAGILPLVTGSGDVFSFERESCVTTLDPQKHTLLVRAGSNSDLMKQLIFSVKWGFCNSRIACARKIFS
ncbi:signal peptidase complex subunit 3 [Prionailurus iriomotensis]